MIIQGNVGIGTTSPGAKLHVVGDVRANNIWVKIAEVDLSASTGYTVSGLDGDTDRVYKVYFQGSLASAGADRRILIRLNGDATSTNYRGYACYDGDASGSDWEESGFYPGRSGWALDCHVGLEYTIFARSGVYRTGYGEAVFRHSDDRILGFGRAHSFWEDSTANVTSLWIGPKDGGSITGRLTVFATRPS